VGGFDGQIHAYDTKSGQVRWVRRVGEPFSSSLVIADGVIYGLTIRMTVVGLDPETGRLLARYTPFATSSESSQGRLLHLGGRMFMASSSFLYAMEISHE
jgi:outer membrane protein assembly factor BamB